MKRILHLDMDAFFASVEQADNPELRGRPVIVGGRERGVVSACSYEARKFGVHSAMPTAEARRRCPHGVFVPGRMRRYQEVSQRIMAILDNFSPLVERASIDEAYLDITGMESLCGSSPRLATALKQAIRDGTGLACSIGIAPVKFLAKIASDYNKPDGLFILEPEQIGKFLQTLPIEKIPGVGQRSLEQLRALNITYAADVQRYSKKFWIARCGKWGEALYERGHGRGSDVVETCHEAKSESAENTFERDTADRDLLRRWLLLNAERVSGNLRRSGVEGRTVTLKIKFTDFQQVTRSKTFATPTNSTKRIFQTAAELLEMLDLKKDVRLIGVGVSKLEKTSHQLSLLEEELDEKQTKLDAAMDGIRARFGGDSLVRGRLFDFTGRTRERP
ncbi:MAG: DNA polymerase IV [Desulfuromonadaceae bacterium]|nr:DNA polymerase IV [Desulfuromonadaceae bacterium]